MRESDVVRVSGAPTTGNPKGNPTGRPSSARWTPPGPPPGPGRGGGGGAGKGSYRTGPAARRLHQERRPRHRRRCPCRARAKEDLGGPESDDGEAAPDARRRGGGSRGRGLSRCRGPGEG